METHAQTSLIKGAMGFSTMVTDKSVAWISGILLAVEYCEHPFRFSLVFVNLPCLPWQLAHAHIIIVHTRRSHLL